MMIITSSSEVGLYRESVPKCRRLLRIWRASVVAALRLGPGNPSAVTGMAPDDYYGPKSQLWPVIPYESSGVSAESLRGCLHSQVTFEEYAEKA